MKGKLALSPPEFKAARPPRVPQRPPWETPSRQRRLGSPTRSAAGPQPDLRSGTLAARPAAAPMLPSSTWMEAVVDAAQAFPCDVGVDLRGRDVRVAEHGLQRPKVRSVLEPRVMAVSLVGILVAVVTDWITQAPERSLESRSDGTLELIATLFHVPAVSTGQPPGRHKPPIRRGRAPTGRAEK